MVSNQNPWTYSIKSNAQYIDGATQPCRVEGLGAFWYTVYEQDERSSTRCFVSQTRLHISYVLFLMFTYFWAPFQLCVMLQYSRWRNWQFTVSTMQSARGLSILSNARSVLLHIVLYSIWIREWMTEPTDCRGKEGKHGAESCPQISSNFSHIICTFG